MAGYSRRTFLLGAGSGVVAGGAVVTTAAAPMDAVARRRLRAAAVSAEAPLVAYVRDVTTDEISLMVGDREVVVTDRALVARLVGKIG